MSKERQFNKLLKQFYTSSNRNYLPWRKTHDPYKILISEVMLQQTQVSRVESKFEPFVERFPTVEILAKADLAEVLSRWSGLGYNRRAKYLHQCARKIVGKHNSQISKHISELIVLPGVGEATAGAIVVYAYNVAEIFIETNIRRAIIDYFFSDKNAVHDKHIKLILKDVIDRNNPREWYWSLVDYGASLGKVKNNPNKKSVHYTKQTLFLGSKRQVRGSVIKLLVQDIIISEDNLKRSIEGDQKYLKEVLKELVSEGLIDKSGQKYRLSTGR
ncbi:hypothetical protein A2801_01365 [Candidatus Woesebacteria bacterium RIFCSPHIGHO2_01_FULL_41_10]|uniref:HhH-GPD domain-containing protein n=1 Tax=Candidatus Woesebacteria bacterium RIFCSPHIGHO2_01_FULL_41_10 TaxID=1802500 RepID=A0A1F7YSN8_9BACT|nr:MAG: hypothetical protein A2801_01365 [Candidatus Woesebacteria bacterium RIFCSPHIGHO2_01_FULL_41_10]